jgi:hypothetical protein
VCALAVLTIVLAACGAPPPPADSPGAGGAVQYRGRTLSAGEGDCDGSLPTCATVRVDYIEAVAGGSALVRDNVDIFIHHSVVSRLRAYLPEEVGDEINGADGLAAAFLAQHRAFIADFPDAAARWFIEIAVSAPHNTPDVTTLDLTESAFTGGAHPNSRRQLASFDVAGGRLLGIGDLTGDVDELTAVVERAFRLERGLGPDDDLGTAGFWFPEDVFTLTENVGVVAEGLLFCWNDYEIAPHSMGTTVVLVPAADLEGIVTRRLW